MSEKIINRLRAENAALRQENAELKIRVSESGISLAQIGEDRNKPSTLPCIIGIARNGNTLHVVPVPAPDELEPSTEALLVNMKDGGERYVVVRKDEDVDTSEKKLGSVITSPLPAIIMISRQGNTLLVTVEPAPDGKPRTAPAGTYDVTLGNHDIRGVVVLPSAD